MEDYTWIQNKLNGLYQSESKEILDTMGVIGLIEQSIGQPINSVQDLYKAVSRKQEYVHYAMNELCTCTEIGEGTVDWMEENPLEDIKGMRKEFGGKINRLLHEKMDIPKEYELQFDPIETDLILGGHTGPRVKSEKEFCKDEGMRED